MIKGKKVTIYDITLAPNISIATISRALNNDPAINKKTKQEIFDLAEELGPVPIISRRKVLKISLVPTL